jgi:hypothetical protein
LSQRMITSLERLFDYGKYLFGSAHMAGKLTTLC